MPKFNVMWQLGVDANSHEEAALEGAAVVTDPSNTATCFVVKDEQDVRVVVDTEKQHPIVLRDERKLTSHGRGKLLAAEIENQIALLRRLINDPVSIKYGEHVDFEVRPALDDDCLLVGRAGHGHINVNYTGEALILDVWQENLPNGPVKPMFTRVFEAADIANED